MIITEKTSHYRILSFLIIFGITIVWSAVVGAMNGSYLDDYICILFLNILFLLSLLFELEYERRIGGIGHNSQTSFSRVTIGYTICCFLMIGFQFLPEYYRPFILISLIMCAMGNTIIAMCCNLYFIGMFTLVTGGSTYEMLTYCMMTVVVLTFVKALNEQKYRIFISIIYFLSCSIVPAVFYYFNYKTMKTWVFIYGIVEGFVIALFTMLVYARLKEETEDEITFNLLDMVQDNYPLVVEVKAYSRAEYVHAKCVSDLCYRCAQYLEYDKDLCAAAGFYYRLGHWEGEPFVENGIRKAQEYCFPMGVTRILSEYYGELAKPSTRESALVHMIDALIKKLEILEKDVGQSTWNRDLIIYQTLNEFSSTGMYDESGISINQFLKIREYLVKEAKLL